MIILNFCQNIFFSDHSFDYYTKNLVFIKLTGLLCILNLGVFSKHDQGQVMNLPLRLILL